ncbi:hypothetical protein HPB52_013814 [Rhipicephalus sanguineus]|uniref:Uncharacterized protein n=1 Tax=Rhipicephalus sanguineus TaxID=34632 RepID=A0A9D4SZ48_RHISA|nr:hypothetical protein HPB52_013814 [Rhipicephalus sanguineus]
MREVETVSSLPWFRTQTPPEIQVDLVGSRTPSPEEVVTYIAPERSTKKKGGHPRRAVRQRWRDEQRCQSGQLSACQAHLGTPAQQQQDCKDIADLKNDPELREFAVAYIKGILEQAQVLAQEVKNTALKKAAGPWYSRIRAAVTRCLRTGCLCVVRRQAPP